MSKMTLVLAAALVVQLALLGARWGVFGAGGSGAPEAAREGRPILGGVTAEQVARLKIADQAGVEIELARGRDEGWVVASAGDYPTKPDAVKKLLDKMLGLRSTAVAAESKRSHAGLEVAEGKAQRDVRLLAADGRELARLFLGRAVAGGSFVRRGGEDAVHRVEETIAWEASTAPATYIDTALLALDPAEVVSVTVTRAGAAAPLALERGTAEGAPWRVLKPVEFEPAKEKAEELARAAARVYFQKPVAPKALLEHGLEPVPAILVEAKTKDGTVHKVEIGAKSKDGTGRYARKGGASHVVEVNEHAVAAFEKDAEHYRPAPPAPPPGTPPSPGVVPPPK